MSRTSGLALGRVIFATLAVAAILVQLVDLGGRGILKPVSYFSYFTIDSNLIAVACLLAGAALRGGARSASLDLVRGGAVVYMSVTGIVFTLLLSGTDVDTAIPWVNSVVHELMPLVIVSDWLLDPPHGRLRMLDGPLWLSFPSAWIVYILIRGAIGGLYPYPFLNPANGGYGTVAAYCGAILLIMLVVCCLVVILGNVAHGGQQRWAAAAVDSRRPGRWDGR